MFEIIAPTVEHIGKNGRGRITVKVVGYWSADPITVYIDREFIYNSNPQWKMTLSHSSGGRDTKVTDDMTAGTNFANAMLALIDFSRNFFNENLEQFEQHYQQNLEVERKRREEEAQKKQEKLSLDTLIGEKGATELLTKMVEKFNGVTTSTYYAVVRANIRVRGDNTVHCVTFRNRDKATFKLNNVRHSKADMVKQIANYAEVIDVLVLGN